MKEFNYFIKTLKQSLQTLPGVAAQIKMAPITRLKELSRKPNYESPRKSAVLILFYPDGNKIITVLIERAADKTVHSGQISFPGGKFEKTDQNLEQTALREAAEEIGIEPDEVRIIGPLTQLYIPPSNFDVFPFVGYSSSKPQFKTNHEVESLLEVDVETLAAPENCTSRTIKHLEAKNVEVPCYHINNHIIWGATSMIISELLEVIHSQT